VQVEQTFTVASPPEAVFDYVTDPANLRDWQTSKTRVEPLMDGPPRQGFRVREWQKGPGGKEFEQVVEFTAFERPRKLVTHIVEGPYPVDGTWTFTPADGGTRVDFLAEGELHGLMRAAGPLVKRMIGRQFAAYHENLRRNVESRD
jgi:uncharacterized protein YndB with AHSA1/START domain